MVLVNVMSRPSGTRVDPHLLVHKYIYTTVCAHQFNSAWNLHLKQLSPCRCHRWGCSSLYRWALAAHFPSRPDNLSCQLTCRWATDSRRGPAGIFQRKVNFLYCKSVRKSIRTRYKYRLHLFSSNYLFSRAVLVPFLRRTPYMHTNAPGKFMPRPT